MRNLRAPAQPRATPRAGVAHSIFWPQCLNAREWRMALDQDLAASIRKALAGSGGIREVSMFGGTGFMLNGNLMVGASKRGLLVRVGKEKQAEALAKVGARAMQ